MAERKKGNGKKREYTVTSKVLTQRKRNLSLLPANTEEERDYNSRQIEHVLRIQEIAMSANRDDLVSLQSCFVNYLKLCQEDGFKISNISAYAAMGMTKNQFHSFMRYGDQKIKDFCSKVQMTCSVSRETLISDNQINPVIGIFWQRNFDGLRNDTEEVQANEEMEDNYSEDQSYKDKYKNLVDE